MLSSSNVAKAQVSHGIVSIVFDDEYSDQYAYAWPTMQSRNINGTFYVVTDNVGKSGYMSWTQLVALQNAGNEIGSHSKTHTDFINLTQDEIRQECSQSKTALENYGLTVNNFAYPNGNTNDIIDTTVAGYYRSGRTAYIPPYVISLPVNQFRVEGFSTEGSGNDPLSGLIQMVNRVIETNGWAIILFHHIKPTADDSLTVSTQDFAKFLDYVIDNGVETLTVNQVLNLKNLSIDTNYGTVSPTSGLYRLNQVINIQATAPTAETGVRYVWVGWNGSGNGSYTGANNPATITIRESITQTAVWKKQILVSFTASGLPEGYNANVLVNSENHTLPYSVWVDEGVSLEVSYPDQLTKDNFVYNVDSAVHNLSLIVTDPVNFTVSYSLQNNFLVLTIIIMIVALSVAIGTLSWKRRKSALS